MAVRPGAVAGVALNAAATSLFAVDREFWSGRRVLLTGLTGFKGSWLGLWLSGLGAEVLGCSLAPETEPNLFGAIALDELTDSRICDVCDARALAELAHAFRPQVVLHLAAQSQVLVAHDEPVRTFQTNVMGTVHVLELLRTLPAVEAAVIVTTDKCYRNRDWPHPYRESDELGGDEPYAASKACAEIVTSAYRTAFMHGGVAVASARAGNVLGGGDFASNRLLPDAARAFARGAAVDLRRPGDVRPWQHVLDPLGGYLMLARALSEDGPRHARAWNFGPDPAEAFTVRDVVDGFCRAWSGAAGWRDRSEHATVPEHGQLLLESSLARRVLGWQPRFGVADTVADAAGWYRGWAAGESAGALRARCQASIARWHDAVAA